MLRVIAALAAVVGLITGLGTVVGWIASDSFDDAIKAAALGAGIAYGALTVGVFLWDAGPGRGAEGRLFNAFYGLLGLVLLAYAIIKWYEPALYGLAIVGVGFAIAAAVALGLERYKQHKRSRKRCPDCIELVKVEARVCRYCGYRFPVNH